MKHLGFERTPSRRHRFGGSPKKLMLALVLLVCVLPCKSLSAEAIWDLFFGFQFFGNHKETAGSVSADTAVNSGVSWGVDLGLLVFRTVEFGLGGQGQMGRSLASYPGNFNFDDVFVSLRMPFRFGLITLYPVGRIGYGFFFGDAAYTGTYGTLAGGLYCSLGFGIRGPEIQDPFSKTGRDYLFVEAAYDTNSGSTSRSLSGYSANIVYTAMSLCVGIGGRF